MKQDIGTIKTKTGNYTITCEIRELTDKEKYEEALKIAHGLSRDIRDFTDSATQTILEALVKLKEIYAGSKGRVSRETEKKMAELAELLTQLRKEKTALWLSDTQKLITLGKMSGANTTECEEEYEIVKNRLKKGTLSN